MTRTRTPARTPGTARAQSKTCPGCARPAAKLYAPFCSKRCSDVDLGRWLNESYAIPVSPEEESELPVGDAFEEGDEG